MLGFYCRHPQFKLTSKIDTAKLKSNLEIFWDFEKKMIKFFKSLKTIKKIAKIRIGNRNSPITEAGGVELLFKISRIGGYVTD